jgi:histidine phosphotransferase ChpT
LTTVTLAPLDLAALLCSRICHDVISPVGAIVNGLEVLEDEDDAEMRSVAMDLIKKSAVSASARLQFCRLAFGAAGSLGATVDTGDAENVARGLIGNERTTLRWNAQRRLAPKNVVKLLLNLCLIAAGAAPRGGTIEVDLDDEGEGMTMRVEARGANVRLSHAAANFLSGAPAETVDAHSIQPYYAMLLARECGMTIKASSAPDTVTVTVTATPPAPDAQRDSQTPSGREPVEVGSADPAFPPAV